MRIGIITLLESGSLPEADIYCIYSVRPLSRRTAVRAANMEYLQNWLLLALIPPALWAIACLVDSCLIGNRIYHSPIEGVIVSQFFCLVPFVFLVFTLLETTSHNSIPTADWQPDDFPISAVVAGLAYTVHMIFYFRILFRLNDASGTETFMLLSVLVVPFLAWAILGEVLPTHFYLAFLVAAIGIFLQCLPAIKSMGRMILINLTASMMAISVSTVLQAQSLHTHGFVVSAIAFNGTCFLCAAVLLIGKATLRRRIVSLFSSFPAVLVGCEVLVILALLSSQRATQLGPSVSLVTLIECLLPLFIISISLVVVGLNRYTPIVSVDIQKTLTLQTSGISIKILASVLCLTSVSTILN